MIKQQVYINGLPKMVLQTELAKDDNGMYYKHYNEDMTVDIATIEAEATEQQYQEVKKQKIAELGRLIVTISTGKRFYADPESRTDLVSAAMETLENNIPDSYEIEWKTPDGIMNVTASEIREAKRKALEEKARIIGVI
jgi:ribosomal protein S4E